MTRINSSLRSVTGEHGFGMLEVLITLLITAVALLGVAAMQSTALRLASSSQARSQAVLLAADMMERMRSNRANAAAYVDGFGAVACDLNFVPGAAADTATNDLAEWRNQLACYLAEGDGQIRWDAATSTATIDVRWNDSRSGGDQAQTLNFVSQLQ